MHFPFTERVNWKNLLEDMIKKFFRLLGWPSYILAPGADFNLRALNKSGLGDVFFRIESREVDSMYVLIYPFAGIVTHIIAPITR